MERASVIRFPPAYASHTRGESGDPASSPHLLPRASGGAFPPLARGGTADVALNHNLVAVLNIDPDQPNLRELSEVVGERLDDEAAFVRAAVGLVKSRQAEIVALTLGHRGALLVARDRVLRAAPLPITPVSTVGAGDSFLGAMVWSLAAGLDLEHAFRLDVAAGSSALLNLGTELSHPDDTRRLFAEVVVTAL